MNVDRPDQDNAADDDEFSEDAYLEELEVHLENLDDPDLVLIDDVWYGRDDPAIEGLTRDPRPSEADLAGARARVAEYQERRADAHRRATASNVPTSDAEPAES